MTYLLIAVLVVVIVSHFASDLARLRRYDWFAQLASRLAARVGADSWQQPWGLLLTPGLPLLAIGVIQSLLAEPANGLFGLLFAIAILFWAWGPRDLDRDIEVTAAGTPLEQPVLAGIHLQAAAPVTGAGFAAVIGRAAQRRWFGPLFWFVLLGAFGAALYRLSQLAAEDDIDSLSPRQREAAIRLLAILDWPVAHLMAFGMAIATDFDTVLRAWRGRVQVAGGWLALDPLLVPAVTAAAIKADLEAEGEIADAAVEGFDEPVPTDRGPVLRDAQAVVWRVLIVWLALLALASLASLLS